MFFDRVLISLFEAQLVRRLLQLVARRIQGQLSCLLARQVALALAQLCISHLHLVAAWRQGITALLQEFEPGRRQQFVLRRQL